MMPLNSGLACNGTVFGQFAFTCVLLLTFAMVRLRLLYFEIQLLFSEALQSFVCSFVQCTGKDVAEISKWHRAKTLLLSIEISK